MQLNDLECFTNVITTAWSTAKRGKNKLYHCAKESVDNEQPTGTGIQEREKSEAGERETELNRNKDKKRWRNGEGQGEIKQDKGWEKREVPGRLYLALIDS